MDRSTAVSLLDPLHKPSHTCVHNDLHSSATLGKMAKNGMTAERAFIFPSRRDKSASAMPMAIQSAPTLHSTSAMMPSSCSSVRAFPYALMNTMAGRELSAIFALCGHMLTFAVMPTSSSGP